MTMGCYTVGVLANHAVHDFVVSTTCVVLQRRDCQDVLTVYGPSYKPVTRFHTDTSDLADLAVGLAGPITDSEP